MMVDLGFLALFFNSLILPEKGLGDSDIRKTE